MTSGFTRAAFLISALGCAGCTVEIGRRSHEVPSHFPASSAIETASYREAAAPPVSGRRLRVAPGETAAARAIELEEKLQATERDRTALKAQLNDMTERLDAKDKALVQATLEVIAMREEAAKTRDDVLRWQSELATLRERLQRADTENLATLQATAAMLQKILENNGTAEPAKAQTAEK